MLLPYYYLLFHCIQHNTDKTTWKRHYGFSRLSGLQPENFIFSSLCVASSLKLMILWVIWKVIETRWQQKDRVQSQTWRWYCQIFCFCTISAVEFTYRPAIHYLEALVKYILSLMSPSMKELFCLLNWSWVKQPTFRLDFFFNWLLSFMTWADDVVTQVDYFYPLAAAQTNSLRVIQVICCQRSCRLLLTKDNEARG